MKERKQIAEQFKWDLTKLCSSDDEFYSRLESFKMYSIEIAKFEGKLSDDNKLLRCLKLSDKAEIELSQLAVFSHCKRSEDVRNSASAEMAERLENVATDYFVKASYIVPELSKFSDKKLKQIISSKKFCDYKREFEDILRHKKHALSKKEEKLLSGMSFLGGFSDNFDNFSDGDLSFNDVLDERGKKHKLDHSLYHVLLTNKDEVLRKNTFKEFNAAYGRNINFLASNYISSVKADCYFAKIRGFKSALAASIFSEEASQDVYKKLIEKVHENIDIFYKYMQIKRKMLGQKTISISDCFAPVTKAATKKYTFDEAVEIVANAVSPLGKEYVSLVRQAVYERWIDIYPNAGKDSGAYSTHAYNKTPLVLLNFSGTLDDVFTLAHELGHALHSYFSMENQKYQTHDYVIFVAEVASTTNEMLLFRYLLSQASTKEEKIAMLDKLFSDVKSTIFRQTMFSEFEALAHEIYEKGEPLSKDRLCKEYYELNKFYFGKNVKLLDEVKFEWARIPHFFRPFYVYKYATGLICAIYFSKELIEHGKLAQEKYLGFLSAGSSKDPISILKDAGCDLESDATFSGVFSYLRDMLKEWQSLI